MKIFQARLRFESYTRICGVFMMINGSYPTESSGCSTGLHHKCGNGGWRHGCRCSTTEVPRHRCLKADVRQRLEESCSSVRGSLKHNKSGFNSRRINKQKQSIWLLGLISYCFFRGFLFLSVLGSTLFYRDVVSAGFIECSFL